MNTIRSPSLALLIAAFVSLGAPQDALATTPGSASVLPVTPVGACDWDRPGANAYRGDVVAAVDRYQDIAPDVRERLKARMTRRAYDDVVSIRRDSITGKGRYGSTIRDMHFGADRVCHTVSRSGWTPAMQERGLVYCDSGQCILVPTVCRNVSRIVRAEVADERVEGEDLPPAQAPPAIALAPPLLLAERAPAAGDAVPAGTGREAPSFASASARELPGSEALVPVGFVAAGPISGTAGSGFVGAPVGGAGGGAVGGGGGGGGTLVSGGGVTPVPEPETWLLLLGGLGALGLRRWRRRQASAPQAVSSSR